jgi:hypothetical protein
VIGPLALVHRGEAARSEEYRHVRKYKSAVHAFVAAGGRKDEIAALVAPFGGGPVGLFGPHPEAPVDRYHHHGLVDSVMGERDTPTPDPRSARR